MGILAEISGPLAHFPARFLLFSHFLPMFSICQRQLVAEVPNLDVAEVSKLVVAEVPKRVAAEAPTLVAAEVPNLVVAEAPTLVEPAEVIEPPECQCQTLCNFAAH